MHCMLWKELGQMDMVVQGKGEDGQSPLITLDRDTTRACHVSAFGQPDALGCGHC